MWSWMSRFSLSVFLNALVMILAAIHLIIAPAEEATHSLLHNDFHSEHHHSQKQGSTITQSEKQTTERQRFRSHSSRNAATYRPVCISLQASITQTSQNACVCSVVLRI